jgi:hypothetical protein
LQEVMRNLVARTRNNRAKTRPKTPTPSPSPSPIPQSQAQERLQIEKPDVSSVEYEVSIEVWVDKDLVMTRTRVYRLGDLKFQQLLAEAIKKAAINVGKPENQIKWVGGRVELRHNGIKKIGDYPKSDIEDDGDWDEVEKLIKRWMLRKHTNIRGDIQFKFKQVAEPVMAEREPISESNEAPARVLAQHVEVDLL